MPLSPPERPIYLLGESMGGILALAAAGECPELVDRVILVNPASSYPRSIWPLLAPLLSQVGSVRSGPIGVAAGRPLRWQGSVACGVIP